MKTKLALLTAIVALAGGALAADPTARLSIPSPKTSKDLPALAPVKSFKTCQSMLVTNSQKLKGMGMPLYANCNSPALRNSSDCQRHCAR